MDFLCGKRSLLQTTQVYEQHPHPHPLFFLFFFFLFFVFLLLFTRLRGFKGLHSNASWNDSSIFVSNHCRRFEDCCNVVSNVHVELIVPLAACVLENVFRSWWEKHSRCFIIRNYLIPFYSLSNEICCFLQCFVCMDWCSHRPHPHPLRPSSRVVVLNRPLTDAQIIINVWVI